MNCPQPQQPCAPEQIITCVNVLMVCCIEYSSIDEAWKKTGIPPHRLRFMAKSPAFPSIYWA